MPTSMWSMPTVAAPTPCPMRIARPSSNGVPMGTLARRASGQYRSTMGRLNMKPPAVSTTPRRARTVRRSRSTAATRPTTTPSSTTNDSTAASVTTRAPLAATASRRRCMRKPPAASGNLGWWPRGAGGATSVNGQESSPPE